MEEQKTKNIIKEIKKRDGRIVSFEKDKITEAIFKALTATNKGGKKLARHLSNQVVGLLNKRLDKEGIPSVEEVQDIVEEALIAEGLAGTAKAYILYREKRRQIRESQKAIDESLETVDSYLNGMDWEVKENANMAFSLQGLNQYLTSAGTKKYWLNKIYPREIREATLNGDFHIHDLNTLSTYCCGWDLYDLLIKGFGGVPTKVESKPPKHFKTALGQLVNFFFTLQGECYSADTQVLTESGWKYFYDVKKTDKVYTLNAENKIELQQPVRFFEFDNNKKLYNFKSKKIDLLVTPNHNMVVTQLSSDQAGQAMKFVKAKNFNPDNHYIPISKSDPSKLSKVVIKKVEYQGKVYCLEVPNHTLYVRRKDRACWCGNSAGAQAVSSFDTLLAPFIRYDNLNYQQVKQAMQEFVFNCAVPTRVGFQTPFLNVTLDINPPKTLSDQAVVIGGETKDETYGDFQEEMNAFNQAFAEVMTEGDANGRVFTFPIPTINITKDFNWDDPALEKIWGMTAKYGIPYFANFIHSSMKPEDVRSMCCRLRLSHKELHIRGGGLFGSNPLTGSIGVVTVNLPRIGYISKTKQEFFKHLEKVMDLAKESLEIKRKTLENFMEKGLYPYSKYYLAGIKKMRKNYWDNHFSTIGLVGMNEALLNFLDCDIGSSKGIKFALKIMDFMRDRLKKYQEKTGNLYNLEATPAESTAYRLAKIDKKKYKDIITAGDKEPYYTNSTQLPVGYTDDLFEALELQDELQCKYSGGTVVHGFAGEKLPDGETAKKLIKKAFNKFKLPYFTLTPTFSICPHHGYISGEHFTCPKCTIEQPCEVYSRVVGYLRPVSQYNHGKKEEFHDRKEFKLS